MRVAHLVLERAWVRAVEPVRGVVLGVALERALLCVAEIVRARARPHALVTAPVLVLADVIHNVPAIAHNIVRLLALELALEQMNGRVNICR